MWVGESDSNRGRKRESVCEREIVIGIERGIVRERERERESV